MKSKITVGITLIILSKAYQIICMILSYKLSEKVQDFLKKVISEENNLTRCVCINTYHKHTHMPVV